MTKTLKEILILLILSVLLGLGRYSFLDDSFHLIKKPRILEKIESETVDGNLICDLPDILSEPMQIDLEFAKCLFDQGKALFVDARDQEDYQISHIKGAVNIPYDEYEDFEYLLDEVDDETILVIYCSGGECSLSVDLGDYLFYDRDFFNILMFEGGLPQWQEAGYPTQ